MLPFEAIAFHAAEDEERQRQAELEAAERQRAWEAAVERARERHVNQQRADSLAEQAGQVARGEPDPGLLPLHRSSASG